jgi:hypothetical protein
MFIDGDVLKYNEYLEQGLRKGQAMYLVYFEKYPQLVRSIANTEYDCFYSDSRIEDFINILIERLNPIC